MAFHPSVTKVRDNTAQLRAAIERLADARLLVGIPKVASPRTDGQFTNAEIGYVQENGAPEVNLPARPHLRPTVRENRALILKTLRRAGEAAFEGETDRATGLLDQLGLALVARVKAKVRAGIPPELAASTVAARIRRRKSASWRKKRRALIAANVANPAHAATEERPGAGVFVPLIDTGNYLGHITYVLRSVRSGTDVKVGPVQNGKS
jgi:hypothetical protein